MFEDLPTSSTDFHDGMLRQCRLAATASGAPGANSQQRGRQAAWFERNHARLFAAWSCLGDEASRRLYLFLIASRIVGPDGVGLPVSFAHGAEQGPAVLLSRGQYFYARDGVEIAARSGDIVIDGGALDGASTLAFSNAAGAHGRVIAFEPSPARLRVLNADLDRFPLRNVAAMPFRLSDRDVANEPVPLDRIAPSGRTRKQPAPVRTIDSLVASKVVHRIDFMKLDLGGGELAALRGAQRSIRRFRPRLAVALSHQPDDLFEIILDIRGRFAFYTMHLDHYTSGLDGTVLYAMAGSSPQTDSTC